MCIIISSEKTERLRGLLKDKYNAVKLTFDPESVNSKSHTCSIYCTNNNSTVFHMSILNQELEIYFLISLHNCTMDWGFLFPFYR